MKLSEQEREGVKMIKALQKCAGITEPTTKALKAWRSFSSHERGQTRLAYGFCCAAAENSVAASN